MRHRRRRQTDNVHVHHVDYDGDDDADDHVTYNLTRHRHCSRWSHGWWWS